MNLRPRRPQRPTADLIVMFLAGIVGFVVVFSTIAYIALAIFRPDISIAPLISKLGDITIQLIGVIVGYIGGRGTTKAIEPPLPPKGPGK